MAMTESRPESFDNSPSRTTIMCANLSVCRCTGHRQYQLWFPRFAAAHQHSHEVATAVHGGDLLGVVSADRNALSHPHGAHLLIAQRGVGERGDERRWRRQHGASLFDCVLQRLERECVLNRMRSACQSSQFDEMADRAESFGQIAQEHAYVRADRTLDVETPHGLIVRRCKQELRHRYLSRRAFDFDAASCEFMETLTVDLDGRHHWWRLQLRAVHRTHRGGDHVTS